MDIPAEYQDAVKKLLQKLMAEKQVHTIENSYRQENNKISNHPDLEHLIVVYENQTGKEKSKGMAQNRNGIGFNKYDAPILTTIAEKYLECGYVSDDDFAVTSKLIRKYHAQWEK